MTPPDTDDNYQIVIILALTTLFFAGILLSAIFNPGFLILSVLAILMTWIV